MISKDKDHDDRRRVSRRAGTHLASRRPIFSSDSKYLFVVADTCLLVYSTKSGELVHRLNNKSHGYIVSMFINDANNLQLITVTCDGFLSFWDYEDGILIREVNLNVLGIKFAHPGTNSRSLYLAVPVEEDAQKEGLLRLEYVKIDPAAGETIKRDILIRQVTSDERMTAVYQNLAASVMDNNLSIIDTTTSIYRKHLIADTMELTCVAWHPRGVCLATGDSIGRIILWYNVAPTNNSKPVRSTMHWHTNPVGDIAFSAAGNYLLSGGSECVLLKWSVNTPGKPYFLPRMGLPICYVATSADNSFAVTAHTDNSLNIVDANLKIVRVIQGLAFSSHWEEADLDPLPVGLLCDPRTKALVLNGRSGHLQFYDLHDDKQLYYLDITQRNYLSKERNRIVYNVEVIKAAFDRQGNWLATVEYRNDKITTPEIRLKFWKFDNTTQAFCLSTLIQMPHLDMVNCALFETYIGNKTKSFVPLLVTTSNDKLLKFWSFAKDPDDHRQPRFWTCHGVGFYRDLEAGSASFSEDGSVLAVAFEHILALWLPANNVLKSTLCRPRSRQRIGQVAFGVDDCSHLIACSTQESLTVWDALSLSVLWTVEVCLSYLTADFVTNIMAAFSTSGDLFIFRPSNPEPLEIHKFKSDDDNTSILAAAFLSIRDWNEHTSVNGVSRLYFLDSEQMLHGLSDDVEESSTTRKATIVGDLPLTPFALMIAEQRKSGVQQVEAKFHELFGRGRKKIVKEILRTPCHVMPPATEICSVFLASILKPLEITTKEDKDDDDDSSEVDHEQEDEDSEDSDADSVRRPVAEPSTAAEDHRAKISERQLKQIENDNYYWIVSAMKRKS